MSVDESTSDAIHEKIHLDQELASIAIQEEQATSKWQAIKKQPWAFIWCLYAVWTVVLVSFENTASGASLSIPGFRKDFVNFDNGDYVLDAKWQAAFNGRPIASQVVGALFGGQVTDWIGRRKAVMAALVISFAAVAMELVATTNELFFGGKFLNGFAVGTIQACAGTYIGEIVPLALRGMTTCAIALAYTVGPFTVAVIINSTGSYTNRWAYRSIFCSQYGFAGVATLFIWSMPESPWYTSTVAIESAS